MVQNLSSNILGGPAFGIACGIIAVIFLNLIHNELEVEIISTFGLAYLIFYVADVELGVSAVLALVVMDFSWPNTNIVSVVMCNFH